MGTTMCKRLVFITLCITFNPIQASGMSWIARVKVDKYLDKEWLSGLLVLAIAGSDGKWQYSRPHLVIHGNGTSMTSFSTEDISRPRQLIVNFIPIGPETDKVWHLNEIELERSDDPGNLYTFRCDCYLGPPTNKYQLTITRNKWIVKTKTGGKKHSDTDSAVYIRVVGEYAMSNYVSLDKPSFDDHARNALDTFRITTTPVTGTIKKIILRLGSYDDHWFVEYIKLIDVVLKEEKTFNCNFWMRPNERKFLYEAGSRYVPNLE